MTADLAALLIGITQRMTFAVERNGRTVKTMTKLKPCPFRVHGERRASATIQGEYFYMEYFMPCLEESCPCFHVDCGDCYCDRNGAYMRLGKRKDGEADD